jgi:solute:Na+ symporter, SSS family
MSGELSFLDYAAVAAYLLGTLGLGFWIGRRIRDEKDYFLAGRSLPWWAIGMSLVATDIGATDIIGVGGAAYTHGLAVANFEWIGCVPAMIVAAFLFIPFFWRIGVTTIPEYLEKRFNAGVRTALAVCWLAFMACNLGVMLYADALMLDKTMGLDPTACIVATALLVGVYTCVGGLAAVVYTDVVQCAVMIGGCLLVLLIGLYDVGGVGELRDAVRRGREIRRQAESAEAKAKGEAPPPAASEAEHTSLILPVDTKTPFPWTGIFFGLALILSPAYWIGNQAIVQRSFGARSEFEAKASYVWGAVLKNAIPFIVAVPGLIALAKFPRLADGDVAFPMLVSELLPAGLRGVFLAAFFAALMSSVDSYLNSASAILTQDLYCRFVRPAASHRELLWFGRATTAGLVLWGVGFGIALLNVEQGIYSVFQTLMAFFQGPAFAVLMTGLLWRRATGPAALAGFLSGVVCAVSLFTLNQPPVYQSLGWKPLFQVSEPYLYFSIWAFLTSLAVIVVVSFLTKPSSEEKLRYLVYSRRQRD